MLSYFVMLFERQKMIKVYCNQLVRCVTLFGDSDVGDIGMLETYSW